MKKIGRWLHATSKYTHRPWYIVFLLFLAAIDLFILVIPTDGLVIASSVLVPKKWKSYAIFAALGSAIGSFLLVILVSNHHDQILNTAQVDHHSATWQTIETKMVTLGAPVTGVVAASFLPLQPAVVLAGILNISAIKVFWSVFIARLLKYLLFAYLSVSAPHLIKKIPGITGELKKLGHKRTD